MEGASVGNLSNDNWRRVRAWLYDILIAAGPILGAYGLVSQNEIALWVALGAAVLGIPAGITARANLTPSSGASSKQPEAVDEAPAWLGGTVPDGDGYSEYVPRHAA